MLATARRNFLVSALPTGFALATQPISAQTMITTPMDGLLAGEVKIPTSDGGEMPAYRAMPAKGRGHRTVIVIEEIFGVHEHIKDICRRFAQQGYLAIAPELFARHGDPSKLNDIQELIRTVVSKAPDAQVMQDLDSTVAWAAKNKGDGKRLAITGFCWGGRMVWLYAAHNPKVKAGAAWYGGLVRPATPLQPKHPIDIAAGLTTPVLGLYGGQDQGIPLNTVEQMKTELARGRSGSEFVVYPEGPHGFHADYRPSYRAEMAKEAWTKTLAWFQKHGA
jgi:carboxymethylenebutenolidase